jgi:hypothetical protein
VEHHALARQAVAAALAVCGGAVPVAADPRSQVSRHARVDAELAADLIGWAVRLSERTHPPREDPPALLPLADDELAMMVCPDRPGSCRGLVAAYDTDLRRILYRASLDMRDPTDQSFIVHELVHWLQHLDRGAALEASCESMLDAEREAYEVQNRYLVRFKQWQRVGEVLRFTFCNVADVHAGEPTVRFDASTGPITATRAAPVASAPH